MVGTPPTAVFIGKLTTATAAWDGDLAGLAIVVFANSLASLFYYLRWIIPVYRIGAAGNDTISVRSTPSPLVDPRRDHRRRCLRPAGPHCRHGLASHGRHIRPVTPTVQRPSSMARGMAPGRGFACYAVALPVCAIRTASHPAA